MTADTRLRSFIDRILRLREEADALGDDVKEVYAEAKAEGFDKTAMGALVAELRKKGKDAAKFEEANAILDLYRDAYERAAAPIAHTLACAHLPARAREIIEEFAPHDAETGEITEPDATPAGAVVAERNGVTAGETAPSILPRRPAHVLRPHCRRPSECAGYGSKHCGSCERASREVEAAA